MEGVGDLVDVTPPDPRVMALGMDGKWARAEEPLHWLVDSPDPVHSGDPATRERAARPGPQDPGRKGRGWACRSASTMVEATGVPVGLVACAHGGTSMEQWHPPRRTRGARASTGRCSAR